MKWDELGRLLGATAGAVAVLFGLFSAVLEDWVPPTEAMAPKAVTSTASLVALVILLLLVLLLNRRLLRIERRRLAVAAGTAAIAGLGLLWVYYGDLDRYQFWWPEARQADGTEPSRYLRGELNETGRQITRDMSLPAAIAQAGGLEMARRQQLLWDEASRKQVERRLVAEYIALTSLFAGALFGLALAVMNDKPKGRAPSAPPAAPAAPPH